MKSKFREIVRLFELEGVEADMNKSDTYHNLRHKFRNEIIVPIAAISNNIEFLLYDAVKHVRTSDDVECVVETWEEKHICDLEEDVKEIYGVEAWAFMKTWHKFEPCMTSMQFIKMKLKHEGSTNE